MNKNRYQTKAKVGDYILYCDICRMPFWASKKRILGKYTGKEGLVVCPNEIDQIDYGLVPYKIPPEETPKITREAHYASNPADVPNAVPPFDFTSNLLPESATPQQVTTASQNWDELNVNWEAWDQEWGR